MGTIQRESTDGSGSWCCKHCKHYYLAVSTPGCEHTIHSAIFTAYGQFGFVVAHRICDLHSCSDNNLPSALIQTLRPVYLHIEVSISDLHVICDHKAHDWGEVAAESPATPQWH